MAFSVESASPGAVSDSGIRDCGSRNCSCSDQTSHQDVVAGYV